MTAIGLSTRGRGAKMSGGQAAATNHGEGVFMSKVEVRAEPGSDQLEAPDIVPEAALLGTRPIFLRRDPDSTNVILQRVSRVGGIQSVRLVSPDDDPTGGWDDGDTVGQTRMAGGLEVFAIIATLGLVALWWDLFVAPVINPEQLDGQTRLPDGDLIKAELQRGTSGFMEVTLRSSAGVTWWKDVEFRDTHNVIRATAWTQDETHENRLLIPNDQLKYGGLLFGKAKFLGIHAMKYQMFGLQRFAGRHLILNWLADH
jgi:hypothetical protein